MKIPITGCDGMPKTGQAWVRNGTLAATIFIRPNTDLAIEMLVEAIQERSAVAGAQSDGAGVGAVAGGVGAIGRLSRQVARYRCLISIKSPASEDTVSHTRNHWAVHRSPATETRARCWYAANEAADYAASFLGRIDQGPTFQCSTAEGHRATALRYVLVRVPV